MLSLLTAEDYLKTPWKNGNGITEDVLLLPQGASHEDFDIRISRAPIVDESAFSSFPGIERTITRLGENPMVLRFADGHEVALEHLVPFCFDSTLAPSSRLPAGASQVMNVMTRQGRWAARVKVLRGAVKELLRVPGRGLVVVHAVSGGCIVSSGHAGPGQTLIASDVDEVEIALPEKSVSLVAVIEPVNSKGDLKPAK